MQKVIAGISVEIVKKEIKHMHLSVLAPNGKVRVSAPSNILDDSIIMFVRTRINWIKKQQEKFINQPRQSLRQYVSGETLYFWGKQYFLQVEYSYKRNSIILSGDKAILTVRKESTTEQRANYITEWYRKALKLEIEKRLPLLEQATGLTCLDWQTKYMKTRWGTCNTQTKKIWFNLQLAKKPIECLDYVIIHELGHTKIKTHNKDFIAYMDTFCPTWREVRQMLNNEKLDYLVYME